MTTWDMDTVGKVSRLWMDLSVDAIVLAASRVDVLTATGERLAVALVHEAHTFGVDAHPGDIQFDERPRDDGGFGVTVRGYWAPSTDVVELVGGEHDGVLMQIPKVGDRLRMPRYSSPSMWLVDEPVQYPTLECDEYLPVGWRETERRWVYKVASR